MGLKRFLVLSYNGMEVYGSVDASNRSVAYEGILKDAVPHLAGTAAKGFTLLELAPGRGVEEALIVTRKGNVEHGSMAQVHIDLRKERIDPDSVEVTAALPAAAPAAPADLDTDEPIEELAPPPPPGGKLCAYCDSPIDERKTYCDKECATRDRARKNKRLKGNKPKSRKRKSRKRKKKK